MGRSPRGLVREPWRGFSLSVPGVSIGA